MGGGDFVFLTIILSYIKRTYKRRKKRRNNILFFFFELQKSMDFKGRIINVKSNTWIHVINLDADSRAIHPCRKVMGPEKESLATAITHPNLSFPILYIKAPRILGNQRSSVLSFFSPREQMVRTVTETLLSLTETHDNV
ncbi:unnamed protein product [Dovyalis caffra]|uniref:Uncharacterized protein n=1 Tax=Dovyalis caffra TaxID=77055 RepID=A0AAV1SQ71_9ROSI|nr:unnamed protein product [Dovyalis caffra]